MSGSHEAADSAEALAQSRTGGGPEDLAGAEAPTAREPGEGVAYAISDRLHLAHATQLYERSAEEPLYRKLPVFTLDASTRRLDGRVTVLKIPYEPLSDGVRGSVLEVDPSVPGGMTVRRADLDDPHILLAGGYAPSISDPRFHQQMVYAVAMHTYGQFQTALGRQLGWAFDRRREPDEPNRLVLRPFGAPQTPQAWYDRNAGEVVFGYFRPSYPTPSVPDRDGSNVFLSLSHDVIVHEVTHALLDGLKPDFLVACHPDVAAFHEAFADLVAVFQRFAHEEAVMAAVSAARGNLSDAESLAQVGREFGLAILPEQKALRTLLNESPGTRGYKRASHEPHARGAHLATAVFRAFTQIYERRSRRYFKLATGGTGVLPAGDISHDLTTALVSEVRRIALQFLTICIRAIDYCPPVDIRFGDYLRALVTADHDLVPDDDLGYREALIHAFDSEGIYGEGTPFMSEDALLWRPPYAFVPPIREVSFGETHFDGDPARPVSVAELRRQAGAIGGRVADPLFARECGLVPPSSPDYGPGGYGLPIVNSVRSARRVGPDAQVTFDTVAEVVQWRRAEVDGISFTFFGGATLIIGPRGEIRFVIRKRTDHLDRLREQAEYLRGAGARFWEQDAQDLVPRRDSLERMCR